MEERVWREMEQLIGYNDWRAEQDIRPLMEM